jgi:hypothetical protein
MMIGTSRGIGALTLMFAPTAAVTFGCNSNNPSGLWVSDCMRGMPLLYRWLDISSPPVVRRSDGIVLGALSCDDHGGANGGQASFDGGSWIGDEGDGKACAAAAADLNTKLGGSTFSCSDMNHKMRHILQGSNRDDNTNCTQMASTLTTFLTTCTDGDGVFYQLAAKTATSNRACAPCTIACPSDEYVAAPCTRHSDLVCKKLPIPPQLPPNNTDEIAVNRYLLYGAIGFEVLLIVAMITAFCARKHRPAAAPSSGTLCAVPGADDEMLLVPTREF